MSYRIWIVDENELKEGILWQSKQAENAKPYFMDDVKYSKLIRKISYWSIIRDRVLSFGIISVVLLFVLAIVIYFASKQFSFSTWGLILGVVIVINGLFYGLVNLIYQNQKKGFIH